MTPKYQQVVDHTLARMDADVSELIRHCRPASRKQPGETPIEQLRETLLGQHLAAIAHYTEGYAYPYDGDVRASAGFVARCHDARTPRNSGFPPAPEMAAQ